MESKGEVNFKKGFRVPNRSDQLRAIGFSQNESRIPIEYFPHDELFLPLPKPTHLDDWLAQYKEEGQTYEVAYLCISLRFRIGGIHQEIECNLFEFPPLNTCRNESKKHVYLRTLGSNFQGVSGFKLEQLLEFVQTFYPGTWLIV